MRSIYKVRSKRGAIHLSPDYTANHLDSRLILDNCRWILAEILRMFWTADRKALAEMVINLVEFEIPMIVEYDGVPFVLHTGLTAYNEVALVLFW